MKLTENSWVNHFKDTIHSTFTLSNVFFKFLPHDQSDAINREFYAQKLLANTKFVPKPYFKLTPRNFPGFIAEQKLVFEPNYRKTDQFIIESGKALKKLHSFSRKNKNLINKYIPEDDFLVNGTYDPRVILKVFVTDPLISLKGSKNKLINKTVLETIRIVKKDIHNLDKKVVFKSEYCCLIHGDLNGENMVRQDNGRLAFLDWADCRWDTFSCDISQFIYLHFLNKKETKLFLQSYNSPWITKEMLEIHRLLLIGWDIIYLMTVNLKIEPNKVGRLEPLKNKVWHQNIIPL